MFYLIQTNFVNLAIIFFIYIFLLTNTTLNKKVNRIFLVTSLIVNILILVDSTDYYCSTLEYPTKLRYFTSATGYSLRPAGLVALIMATKRFKVMKYKLIFIPLILNMVIAYSSIFTKWMFYFDANNQFYRGVFGSLPFVISAFYMLILIISSINRYRMGEKREATVVFFIAIMSTVAVCMEAFFNFKFLINGIGGISIVFYYLFLHTQTYKRDALTNALNRHSFYTYACRSSKIPMSIVSIDMNNLKTINDKHGHAMGDMAIVTVANCIYAHLVNDYKLYRMGGDEFMILCPRTHQDKVSKMMEVIQRDIETKGYQIAWGISQYEEGMSFDNACSISDSRMYEHKLLLKKKMA